MRSDPPPSPSVRGDDLPSASMPVREDRKILAPHYAVAGAASSIRLLHYVSILMRVTALG